MDRRGFLTGVGTASTIGLAGCVNAPGQGDDAPEAGTEGDATGTGTTTEGGTTTEAGTTAEAEATTEAGTTTDAPNEVAMVTEDSEFYFDPIGLFVESGETISFVIESGTHSSTAYAESLDSASTTRIPEGAEPWDSGLLSEQGASFEHTFETAGTYDYFCIPHKTLGMVARIVVDEPGGVEGDPPDGDVPSEQAIVERGAVSYDEFTG